MGKIKIKCQIRDLKSEVTCYVIVVDMSYNLLFGRTWIHRNSILPSTLHQVMKYADERERVRTLITVKHPFKVIENYFTNSLLYQDPLELADDPTPEDHNSDNETDTKQEPEEECLWEINPLVTNVDKLNFNNTANVEGEWFINENLDLTYFSALASILYR